MGKFFSGILCSFLCPTRGGAVALALVALWAGLKLIFLWPIVSLICYFFRCRSADLRVGDFLYLAICGSVVALGTVCAYREQYSVVWFTPLIALYLLGFMFFIGKFRKDIIVPLRNWATKKREAALNDGMKPEMENSENQI